MEITLPKVITYKEIMMVYGFDVSRAQKKLWVIRGVLGKQQRQSILVAEFCQAENVAKEIFIEELKEAYRKLYKIPQNQLTLFS